MLTRKDMGEVLVNTARVTEVFPGPKSGTVLRFEAIAGDEVKQLSVLDAVGDIADMLGAPGNSARTKRGTPVTSRMAAREYS